MMGDPVTDLTIALEVNYFRQNHAEYFTPIQNMRDYMDIKLSGATVAEWAKRAVEYDTGYNLLPGSYQIKVLARDSETGRIGTYLGKFTIPNLDRETQRVPITSVVLSSQRAPMAEALATAGSPKKAAAAQAVNPLVQDGRKLIPSVTRVFSSKAEMYVYLQAYEPETARPLLVYVTFFQGPIRVTETPAVEIKDVLNAKSRMLPIELAFPLVNLRPGEYECEVNVLDPVGGKAAFWRAPVMVIP